MLDRSKFPDVDLSSDNEYFQPRGTNLPGFKAEQFLSCNFERVGAAFDNIGYGERLETTFFFIVPVVYGGVHLSAWNFEFPSAVEGLLWKIACVAIATAMVAFFIIALVIMVIASTMGVEEEGLLNVLAGITMYSLTLCRIYIVVEAFVSLRAVPVGVYWTPAWIQMIPHV